MSERPVAYVHGNNKQAGLDVNSKKTKYMMISCHQNAVKNRNILSENVSFENVENQISGSNGNKYKRHSQENKTQN